MTVQTERQKRLLYPQDSPIPDQKVLSPIHIHRRPVRLRQEGVDLAAARVQRQRVSAWLGSDALNSVQMGGIKHIYRARIANGDIKLMQARMIENHVRRAAEVSHSHYLT